MHSSPQSAHLPLPSTKAEGLKPRKQDDLAYQAVTVAAILLVLGSLWVF